MASTEQQTLKPPRMPYGHCSEAQRIAKVKKANAHLKKDISVALDLFIAGERDRQQTIVRLQDIANWEVTRAFEDWVDS